MFGSNVMIVQAASFIHGEFDHLFGALSQTTLAQDDTISAPNNKFDGATNLVQLNTAVPQHLSSDTLAFAHKTEQQVFCPDLVVLKSLPFFLTHTQHPPAPLRDLAKSI